ncbi:type II toxin-antitoxin system PemK/MazF family toxin [Paenibacillus wynnii]|uniref:type II toxin-antitoxin system PemK/MazF family toxin n=1 Tax=Paenibacillus wynnii TaxID=268407 RepID=UPI00278CCD7A|nr:type II toxin-antitoxin system PemK/MazF family toxin [Paenibacillus wynnii]MDQ0193841.1 mRNA-degrading endonuclease toxin of MazEF toxin-antitoxin module [Paenibacillus wynnii]
MKAQRIKEKLLAIETLTPAPKSRTDAELVIDIRENLDRLFKVLIDYRLDYGLKWAGGLLRYVDDKEDKTTSKWTSDHWERGHVLEVDFFGHFKNELTFAHPCVVLYDSGSTWILVAPISTPRHGDNNPFSVNIDEQDGMKHPCGVCIDAIRVVDKRRVYYQHKKQDRSNSKLRPEILDIIDEKILEYYLPKTHEAFLRTKAELANEKRQHDQLKQDYEALKKAYEDLISNPVKATSNSA